MNILKICAILIFAVTTQSFSQVSEVWRKSYTQEIESRLIGFKIDNAGNMIAGSSVSRSGIGEFANFVIIKFNSSGDTLWRREYHSAGNKHDHLFDIYIDAAGNIYATGLSTGYQVSEVPTTRTIKYSPSGVLLWEAVDSSNSVMEVNGITKEGYIQEGPNGDIFVCTNNTGKLYMIRYTSSGNLVSHEHIDMPADFNRAFPRKFEIRGSDMYIFCTAVNTSFNYDVLGFKCNILGDTLWTWKNLFNNTLHEAARGMTFDAQGNIYFLSEILNSFTTSSMAVTKLQTSSAVIWEKIYGTGNEKINPADIKTDNSNNVIVICGRQNSANNNKFDAVTLKYNSAGDTVWTKRLKGFGNNDVKPFGLNLDNDQFIYITGQYPLQSSGTQYFQKYSPQGDSVWNFNVQGVNYWSTGQQINFDNAGNAVVASYRENGILISKYANATSVKQISSEVPSGFSLSQNYPNPFNPETVINYKIRSTGFVTLKIYSMDGKEAATLVSGMQTAGSYSAEWNAGNFSSGTYFYRLSAGEYSETKKMILVR